MSITLFLAAQRATHDNMWIRLPKHWPAQVDLLDWCEKMGPLPATLLLIAGIIYLLFGYYIYKWLVSLNAAVLGGYLGAVIGDKLGSAGAGAVLGFITIGFLTWPTMKWAVAIMGGLSGAILGASTWRSFDLDPQFAWSGAMIGLVFLGMLTFLLFRGCVILYTSLQGTAMLILGLLGLLYKYQGIAPKVTDMMTIRPFVLPIAVFIPTLMAVFFQQARYPAQAPAGSGKK